MHRNSKPEPDRDAASLCPPLQDLLAAELSAGNAIAERFVWEGYRFVLLRHPFRARPSALPDGVVFCDLNSGPHWWKSEYCHEGARHIVGCWWT